METFLHFPQTGFSFKASYWPWFRRIRAIFAATGPGPHGYLAFTMTTAEYIAFLIFMQPPLPVGAPPHPVPVAFALLVQPPENFRVYNPIDPAHPLGADAQRSLDAIMLVQFKRAHDLFDKQTEQLTSLRARLCASISPIAEQAAGNPIDGFAFLDMDGIFAAMARKFGCLDSDELFALEHSLDAKWAAGEITQHIASHRHAHEVLRLNLQPLSMSARIQKFQASLSNVPPSDSSHPFYVEIVHYRDSHPDLATLNFDQFADIIARAGSGKSPAPSVAISSIKRSSSASAPIDPETARRIKSQSGPKVFCSFHGWNSTHVSHSCNKMKQAATARGGGGTK